MVPAKRRRLLESDAKEYPAGLIADDGRGAAALRRPQRNHIGPIDPDAFITLNQFLNSLTICATADVLVDDGEVWSDPCPLRAQCIGRASFPIAGWATKNVPLDLGPDTIRHGSCPG